MHGMYPEVAKGPQSEMRRDNPLLDQSLSSAGSASPAPYMTQHEGYFNSMGHSNKTPM